MPDFKDEFSPAAVAALAAELVRAWPAFPREAFVAAAADGLEDLELMARVRHIARALGDHLPPAFADAAGVVDRALASPSLTGWMTLPVGFAVADRGLDEPDIALPLLARLTPRWSSEGPVRPFIERHPEAAMRHLRAWTRDPDEHVRRLVSEGTRPRLPWASRLHAFIDDPSPAVALLDRLYDDPSAYVRRSVANHLNDIAKDHPALAVRIAERWLREGGEGAAWVVRHGLRSLVKGGDPAALRLLGYDADAAVRLQGLTVSPERVAIGGEVEVSFALLADGDVPVVVDYVVHHAGARGTRSPKVFKLTSRTLRAGVPAHVTRRHRFREVSVRRLYPGPHRIEVQVNGRVLGGATVDLLSP